MMQCQALLTFHANQKVKLPLIPQFPLHKTRAKTRKLSHKTHLTSSPFADVLRQRMITVLDVLFCIFGFYKMTMDGLRSISDVRFFVPYYILILIMDAYHYVIDT